MNAKADYKYPDKDDKATQIGVNASEPYAGYWQESEEYVLRFVDDMLKTRKRDALLDIGCGNGRLTRRYARYFNRTVALDPDDSRLKKAEAICKSQSLSGVACVQENFIEASLTDASFDVVICSHVIQHIPSHEVNAFIAKIWRVLKKDGVLVLLTTHSRKRHSVYLAAYVEAGKLVEPVIPELQFNELCEIPGDILPCCLFSLRKLREHLQEFRIARMRVFHALHKMNPIDKFVFRDRIINLPLIRRYSGEDVFVLAVKQ